MLPQQVTEWEFRAHGLIKDAMHKLEEAMRNAATARRSLRAVLAAMPPAEPMIGGVRKAEFKDRPYINVGDGKLRDGSQGPIKATKLVKGRKRAVLAQLLTRSPMHEIEMVAMQADLGNEDIAEKPCTDRAVSIKGQLSPMLTSLGCELVHPDGNVHSPYWAMNLDRSEVVFSTMEADMVAADSVQALTIGDPGTALALADKSLKIDAVTALAHEVVCKASATIGIDRLDKKQALQLTRSRRFINDLVKRYQLMVSIGQVTLATPSGLRDQSSLPLLCHGWEREAERLSQIVTPINEWDAQHGEAASTARLNTVVENLRREPSLGADPFSDVRVQDILQCRLVGRWRSAFLKKTCFSSRSAHREWSQRFDVMILMLIRDHTCPAAIDMICQMTFDALLSEYVDQRQARGEMAAREAAWAQMRGELYMKDGVHPDDETIRQALGWSCGEYATFNEWRRTNPGGHEDEESDDE